MTNQTNITGQQDQLSPLIPFINFLDCVILFSHRRINM